MPMLSRSFVLLILLALLPSRATAQETPKTPAVEPTLAPGDIIRVAVWREADLSGEFLVNENGVVTFPLLGEINVLEIPISQLRDRLIQRYSVDLRNPSITVTPLRRIYVLGEVTKPGLYTVDPTISLAGAVALAGGATPSGDLERLRVIRNGVVIVDRAAAQSSLSVVNMRSDDQVFVDRRGWFDRNSTFAASALLSIVTVTITLLHR
jgi:protein involved in polysaccharide export with SLBB domain